VDAYAKSLRDAGVYKTIDPVALFNRRMRVYKGELAREALRGLKRAGGLRILVKARSPHGSDCHAACGPYSAPASECRCIRALRLRGDGSGDWLLLIGDHAEGGIVQLQGPYHHDTALSYGGGFWCMVRL
jgi:hypothetical protein